MSEKPSVAIMRIASQPFRVCVQPVDKLPGAIIDYLDARHEADEKRAHLYAALALCHQGIPADLVNDELVAAGLSAVVSEFAMLGEAATRILVAARKAGLL